MDASMMARMKDLEAENLRLKKMYAEERLKAEILQEALAKKCMDRRRAMARMAVEQHRISIRLACEAFCISETCYRYQPKSSDEIADWLVGLTQAYRSWGFGLCFMYLRNVKGFGWNHKRIYRIYRELEFNLRIKPKKRVVRQQPEPLTVPEPSNERWSMDFMQDQLDDACRFRLLNVIDDYNREGPGIEADFSLPSARVIRTLDRIIEWRGKPQQNAYIERYNRTVRYHWFGPVHFRQHRGRPRLRDQMALDVQQRNAEHGPGRESPRR